VTEEAGGVCVGWQFAPGLADPGAAPARPVPRPAPSPSPGWIAAQRRITAVFYRPARAGAVAGCASACLLGGAWLAGLVGAALAAPGALAAAAGAAACAAPVVRGRLRLRRAVAAEQDRVARAAAEQARGLARAQREHASQYRAWQRRKELFDRQSPWFAVTLPAGLDRVDVAGGTLAGWSAMLTMLAAPRLDAGGEVTVVDLTEGTVAADLISLARRDRQRALVWVLPGDLPRLDLAAGLDARSLADVLAVACAAAADADLAAGSSGGRPDGDPATDCALLERVLGVLGPAPLIAQVTAGLRVLGDVHAQDDVRSGLITADQRDRFSTLFGRAASDRVVPERALVLESRLRGLDWLGADDPPFGPARLRVAALDRQCGLIGNRMIGTFLVAALTHLLRRTPAAGPWAHTLCLLGAERLGGDLVDRLTDACETSRTGLVLAFRSIPAGVRERLGRGNAAVAFMRLGNGDDARAASELIGTEHRFVVSQLTDTVGNSVTDTWGDSYTSTTGTADSVADSYSTSTSAGGSRGRGRSRPGGFGALGEFSSSLTRDSSHSTGESGSVSLTAGVNDSTSWGISTSRALGDNVSLGMTAQRSREFLVEAEELQRLPVSAMIVSYPAPSGRMVVLADANPAIPCLPGVARPAANQDAGPGRLPPWQTQSRAATIQPG